MNLGFANLLQSHTAALWIASALAPAAGGQLVGFNGHVYGITSVTGTWLEAEAEAVARGGHLAAITSAAENQFVANAFLAAPQAASRPYWIGLTDAFSEGTFAWTSGEALAFTNWHAGEPNDFPPDGEDYAAINWHFAAAESAVRGTWNDLPAAGTFAFNDASDGPYRGLFEVVALPADFDENGAVASADLARWRTGFGAVGVGVHASGDADGDHDVDGRDFLTWQQQLGGSVGTLGGAASAPEPSTLPMLATVTAARMATRRGGRR